MTRRFTLAVLAAVGLAAGTVSCARPQPAVVPAAPPAPVQAVVPAPPASPVPAIPERLTDAEFWRIVTDFSEPNGFFRSDNLLSNEIWLQTVIPELTRVAPPGRVYMGVGPEQNFTYISALKPSMVFIVDVRRGNLDLHLLYKALFELSADRPDFVARLFSRARPSDLPSSASAHEIFAALAGMPPDEAVYAANVRAVEDHLTKTHGFPLSAEDLQGIEYVYRTFSQFGPGLTYWMSGGRFGRNAPTYADLMVATDEAGIARGFLATDENFAVIKGLESRNLIVPVVGNFAGPKALRAVGAYLKAHNAVVSAFYLSNVEQYLNMDGLWMDFCGNVRALPLDEGSTFIRAVRNGQYGYGVGLSNVLGKMVEDTAACVQSAAPRLDHGTYRLKGLVVK